MLQPHPCRDFPAPAPDASSPGAPSQPLKIQFVSLCSSVPNIFGLFHYSPEKLLITSQIEGERHGSFKRFHLMDILFSSCFTSNGIFASIVCSSPLHVPVQLECDVPAPLPGPVLLLLHLNTCLWNGLILPSFRKLLLETHHHHLPSS